MPALLLLILAVISVAFGVFYLINGGILLGLILVGVGLIIGSYGRGGLR